MMALLYDAETAFWRQTFWRPEISIEENLFTFCGGGSHFLHTHTLLRAHQFLAFNSMDSKI